MFFAFLKLIGLTLLGELLRPTPEVQHEKPGGIGDFQAPTTIVGRSVPVIFGRVRQRSPNLLWYGDLLTLPIFNTQKIKGLFKSKRVTTITGTQYYIGLHHGLCHAGAQNIHGVWAAEDELWTGTAALPTTLNLNQSMLFGGPGIPGGGGIVGTMYVCPGGAGQGSVPYLPGILTSPPAFRGLTSAIWARGYIGNRTELPRFNFELSRYPSTALGLPAVGVDCNPAEILWETHTDPVWGLGASTDLLDSAAFSAAGAILQGEGLGLSLIWDSPKSIGDFCEDILRPIDGVLYPSLRDAKVKLELIRGGYDVGTLPVYDTSNVVELKNFSRTAWEETVNHFKILFTSRASGYRQDVATAFDLANFDLQGNSVARSANYPGITVASVANDLAWRDLRASSVPLAKGTLVLKRHAHRAEPGDVIVLRWAPQDIERLVLRVTKVRPGAPLNSSIEVEFIEDVFSLASSAFGAPPASEWVSPVEDTAAAVTVQDLGESPYLLLARDDGSGAAGTVDPDLARLGIVAQRPTGQTLQASVETRVGAATFVTRGELLQFTPTATLVDAYAEDTDAIDGSGTLIVENMVDVELLEDSAAELVASQLQNLAYIEDEVIAWETIADNLDGTYALGNVWRGVLDTVPVDHLAGARIWFSSEGLGTTEDTYPEGSAVSARLVTTTLRAELDPDDATIMNHTITRRSLRPYPPGNVEVNGEPWPEVIEGALVVTWSHRDRVGQTDLVTQDEGDQGPEAGVTYTLRIYGEADVLLRTASGLVGTSYTYSDEVADAGRLQGRLRIELEAVRAGRASHQFQEREFDRAGWGLQWGRYWGGAP